jgi:hypothetical protein
MSSQHRLRLRSGLALLVLTGASLAVATAAPSQAAADKTVAFERVAVDRAHTQPARSFARGGADKSTGTKERQNALAPGGGNKPSGGGGGTTDTVLQSVPTATTTTALANVGGLGLTDNAFSVRYAPPDTNGSVGLTQYVQAVNTQFAVYSKSTGARLAAPFNGSSLFTGLTGAGAACGNHDDGDPVVQYDKAAGRWLITQFQVTVTPYLECVALSDSEDATGAYRVFAYDYGTDFVDYPKIGVWPASYNVTYNVFAGGRTFTGGEVCALDRATLLANPSAAPAQKCFRTSTSYPSLLPSDLDGSAAPPSGNNDAYIVDMSGGGLKSWRLHLDWAGATSSLTGPTAVAGTAAFAQACSGGTCIVQPGTTQKLDSLADRLMNRLAYRVLPSGPSLVVTHAVTGSGTAGVRWYELRPSGSGLTTFQQGTYAPDAKYRWLSTAAMDRTGAIAVGYSASSSSVAPSIRIASRLSNDTLGKLGQENILLPGGGSQSGSNLSRWGDYASMSVDPVDDCTLWFTTEYLTATGAFNWSTRIMQVKTGAC